LVKCSSHKTEKPQATSTVTKDNFAGFESQLKWGEHLVTVSACHDCHTPKKGYGLDSANLLAGYIGTPVADVSRKDVQMKGWAVTTDLTSWVGPWGIAYTANLTSDSTGIGKLNEERFIYAIRYGKYDGLASGRNLNPVMPWTMYRNMTDDELKAIFVYLKSTKPIKNVVPLPLPPIFQWKM
jgi:hypothetical protein